MDCVACGKPAGFNRVIVDLVREIEVGGLCVGCERDAFGQVLENGEWRGKNSCVLCSRDGHFGLPKWYAKTVEQGRVSVIVNEYQVTQVTVRLCDEHFHTISCDSLASNDSREPMVRSM